jgi:hypothetical protein
MITAKRSTQTTNDKSKAALFILIVMIALINIVNAISIIFE